MMKCAKKQKKGISLIVLVITIIVLLVLTAAIIISLNNTGIIDNANNATEKTNIQTATEMLTVKLLDLRKPGEVTKDGRITLKDLIVINSTKEEPEMTVETEYNDNSEEVVKIYTDEDLDYTKVAVDKYIFKVDEKWGIYLLGEGKFEEIKEPELTGSGTEEDPYIILTVKHLQGVRDNLSAHYKLGTNINLRSVANWEPIGNSTTQFTGSLDGQGYSISNMKIEGTEGRLGLFGNTSGATISNLRLEDYTITGAGNYIGGLSAIIKNTTIRRVYTNGTINISNTAANVGGLIGHINYSAITIEECLTEGNINGGSYATNVGGLVGQLDGVSNSNMNMVNNSYSLMNVSGKQYIGGLIGYSKQYAKLTNTYAIGKVTGTSNAGGLVGGVGYSTANAANSYWNKTLSGVTTSVLGTAKTTYALTKQATYTGWDFESVWGIDEGKSLAYLRIFGVPDKLYDVVTNNTEMKGMGTEEDPYIIKTVEDLKNVKNDLKAHYKLGNDIDLKNEANWTPIGDYNNGSFTGSLDGQGYSIKNMTITGKWDYIGLFGRTSNATISNLKIEGYNINVSGNHVGPVVGCTAGTTKIYRVYTNGNIQVTAATQYIGGVVGAMIENSRVEECLSEGIIDVATYGTQVGGLVGFLDGKNTTAKTNIENCYTTVDVTGKQYVGGLVGRVKTVVGIKNSYSAAKVNGTSNVGGFVGNVESTGCVVTNSYWNKLLSGVTTSALGEVKGISSLAKQATYLDWDFTDVWGIDEGKSLAYLKAFGVPDKLYDVVTNNTEMEGSGTESDPYIIKTVEDLKNVKNELSAFYKLANNLDLKGETNWTPLGNSTTKFTGGLDGAGYTISNLTIKDTTGYAGLFGYTKGAKISNLMLTDYKITGAGNYIGAVAGYPETTRIYRVYTKGNITLTGTSERVGGIAGSIWGGATIEECLTEGTIDTSTYGTYVGGLVGSLSGSSNSSKGTVLNSYSTANVTGTKYVGGAIGYTSTTYVTIKNNYAIGKITGTTNAGALIGGVDKSTATNCYYNKPLSGLTTSALGTARSILSLARQETYTSWDFESVWGIDEGKSLAYLKAFAVPEELYDAVTNNTDGEGTGTADDPYIIRTVEELKKVMNEPSAYYLLANNLDLSTETNWTPLGDSTTPFKGNFNGAGYTISNMKINSTTGYLGLFGYISGATIKNLTIDNYQITGGGSHVGALAGSTANGKISNIYTNGTITTTTTASNVGGLVGYANWETTSITQCLTSGTINGIDTASNVGGLIGNSSGRYWSTKVAISNSYSVMDVTGLKNVGGLVGYLYRSSITNSYAIGKVSGGSATGGLVGANGDDCTVTNAYWVKALSGQSTSSVGSVKSIPALARKAGYTSWNFDTIWDIDEEKSFAYLRGLPVLDEMYESLDGYNLLEGTGTSADPYIIRTVEELKQIPDDPAAYYKLANNLDLSGEANWVPLGSSSVPFTGGLDGAGYTISNMKINSIEGNLGLFGYLSAATIKNLTLDGYNITGGGSNIGALAGNIANAKISNIYTNGTITTTTTASNVGGLVGYANWETTSITQCLTAGKINGIDTASNVGGLIGNSSGRYWSTKVAISNSYSVMDVTGLKNVGGLVGYLYRSSITNSYAIGKVSGGSATGGLVGANGDDCTVTNSYWVKALSGQSTSSVGTLKSISALTKSTGYASWNFDTIWAIDEDKSLAYLRGIPVPDMLYTNAEEYNSLEGTGTSADPYIIKTAQDLKQVMDEPAGYYKLGNDVDLSSEANWIPLGSSAAPFKGNFNGAGYAIKNMKVQGDSGYLGLFGYTNGAKISNLVLDNYTITGGGNYIAGLIGYGTNKTVTTGVYTNGTINLTSAAQYVGGLIGYMYDNEMTLSKCATSGKINGEGYGTQVGGLLGNLSGYTAGYMINLNNSYSTMDVSGISSVGGLFGYAKCLNLTNTYAIGKVSGDSAIGGIVGSTGDTVKPTNTYWCQTFAGVSTGGTGTNKSISALSKQSGYVGWDFSTIWAIDEGKSFPYIKDLPIPSKIYEKVEEYNSLEGTGTSADPYIIKTAQDLKQVTDELAGYYKLGNDVDLSGEANWTPLGSTSAPFKGNFNGNGYSIKNMNIQSDSGYLGLFACIDGATMTNIKIEDYTITGGGNYIGGLVGQVKNRSILNGIYTSGNIKLTSAATYVGGAVGHMFYYDISVTKIATSGSIDGTGYGTQVGGLFGSLSGSTAGYMMSLNNSYSTMDVSGISSVGGLFGYAKCLNLTNTYATGKVSGDSAIGGIVGSTGDTVKPTRTYWNTETMGVTTGGTGTGKTTAEMQTQSTYSGWDFDTIWQMNEGEYPTLR